MNNFKKSKQNLNTNVYLEKTNKFGISKNSESMNNFRKLFIAYWKNVHCRQAATQSWGGLEVEDLEAGVRGRWRRRRFHARGGTCRTMADGRWVNSLDENVYGRINGGGPAPGISFSLILGEEITRCDALLRGIEEYLPSCVRSPGHMM